MQITRPLSPTFYSVAKFLQIFWGARTALILREPYVVLVNTILNNCRSKGYPECLPTQIRYLPSSS